MPIVVVGLNHKTAPIALLERLSVTQESLTKALHQLETFEHVIEGVVLSTCNRIEVYATVSRFHGGAQDLRNFLSEFCHVAPEDFADHLYTYHDDGAVRHLLRVAAGIDSMIIGESEILGQVRRAYQIAEEEGLAGGFLGGAFRRALRVGKRARAETAIGRNPVSISSAAVDLARRAFPDGLAGRSVAIVGAGKMGRLAVKTLKAAGAGTVFIVNRSAERGRLLAQAFDAVARSFDELLDVLAEADIVISSTTSPEVVIDLAVAKHALARRRASKPLFVVDIAVPRDVDPAVGDLPGVILRDIEDLRTVVETNVGSRLGEVSKVEEIIGTEIEHFGRWERSVEATPTASALVSKVDGIRRAEIERIRSQLDAMSPEQRAAVEGMSRRLVSKILHHPLKRSRELATERDGKAHLLALRELFGLDDEG